MDVDHHLKSLDLSKRDYTIVRRWIKGYAESTARNYLYDVKLFADAVNKPFDRLTKQDIAKYLATLSESTPGVRNRISSTLKSLLRFANDYGVMNGDIISAIAHSAEVEPRIDFLSVAQVKDLIDATENSRDYALVQCLYYTGITVSEAKNLYWRDFRIRNKIGFFDLKGSRRRIIPIPDIVTKTLQKLRGQLPDDAAVFMSMKTYENLHERTVSRVVLKAAIALDLPHGLATANRLRYAHIAHALQSGARIQDIKTITGFRTLKMIDLIGETLKGDRHKNPILLEYYHYVRTVANRSPFYASS